MSHKLVAMTNTHMARQAQYSAAAAKPVPV